MTKMTQKTTYSATF